MGKVESIRAFAKQVLAGTEQIDILVNNAGCNRIMPVLEVTEEVYDEIIDVNLKSVLLPQSGTRRAHDRTGRGRTHHQRFLTGRRGRRPRCGRHTPRPRAACAP